MRIGRGEKPAPKNASGAGHRFWCSGCREFELMTFAMLADGRLEKRCQSCGHAVAFEFVAGVWLQAETIKALDLFVESEIARVKRKMKEKAEKSETEEALAEFDALAAEYDEKVVKEDRHVSFKEWMVGRK